MQTRGQGDNERPADTSRLPSRPLRALRGFAVAFSSQIQRRHAMPSARVLTIRPSPGDVWNGYAPPHPQADRRRAGPVHRRPGRTPSGRWPSPSATAGGGSSCREAMRKDVTPKNIIMIGPTGVGKTEIARRLAQLVGAPFLKVEATKYTEVGYHGRDVESMVRDLLEIAIGMVREEHDRVGRGAGRAARRGPAARPTCCPKRRRPRASGTTEEATTRRHAHPRQDAASSSTPASWRTSTVELIVEQRAVPVQIFSNIGMEHGRRLPEHVREDAARSSAQQRQLTVREPAGCCSSRRPRR